MRRKWLWPISWYFQYKQYSPGYP